MLDNQLMVGDELAVHPEFVTHAYVHADGIELYFDIEGNLHKCIAPMSVEEYCVWEQEGFMEDFLYEKLPWEIFDDYNWYRTKDDDHC